MDNFATFSSALAEDVEAGLVGLFADMRTIVIDGEAWLIVDYRGQRWAYAPEHVLLATGEASRQL